MFMLYTNSNKVTLQYTNKDIVIPGGEEVQVELSGGSQRTIWPQTSRILWPKGNTRGLDHAGN